MTQEELENLKIQSEIDKNKEEAKKAKSEARYFEKQVNDVWYSGRSLKLIVGGLIAAFALWAGFQLLLNPVFTRETRIKELAILEKEATNKYIEAQNKLITQERDEIVQQWQDISVRYDSLKENNIQVTKDLQARFAKLSENYTQISNLQKLTDAERNNFKKLAEEANSTNSELKQKVIILEKERGEIAINWEGKIIQRTIVPPPYLSSDDATRMIKANNYYDRSRNPMGLGVENKFELQPGDSLIYDAKTELTWQKSGSSEPMLYEETKKYIAQLNASRFAGYSDWRLPTLEEAMSLMEAFKQPGGKVFMDTVFDAKQHRLLTSDTHTASAAWAVTFTNGSCYNYDVVFHDAFVRAVR